jgi:gamma-glutamyl hercynylcysteine S-oxide hydrolase
MCRHLAHLGPPEPLARTLTEPPHSLYRQSWAPRRQQHGTVNADGFGVGWYAARDPVPARYRRARPIWADPSFDDLARVVHTGALLAAVRDITEGCAAEESATAPFAAGVHLFSHNGSLAGWPGTAESVAATLPAADLLALDSRCDSALVWAVVRDALRGGAGQGPALARATGRLAGAAPGSRLNLLLTDGDEIAATAWGDTLWYLHDPARSLTVASEPHDDDPRWREVPDRHVLTGTRLSVHLVTLEEHRP